LADLYASLASQELRARIAWLIRLRWLAAASVALTIAVVAHSGLARIALGPLYLVTAILAAYNGAIWLIARRLPTDDARNYRAAHLFANVQISTDWVFLASLLHFSGGVENPFTVFFVFHTVIASILLTRRAAYFQAVLGSALVAAMALLEAEGLLAHHHLAHLLAGEPYRNPTYLAAQIFVLTTTLCGTAFMATSITARLREREAEVVLLSESLAARTASLEQAYQALRDLERAKSQQMRKVSHELRSPLAAIQTMVAAMLQSGPQPLPAQAQDLALRCQRRAGRLLELTDDLLALSRAREARLAPQMQEVRLAQVFDALSTELSQRAAAKQIALRAEIPPDLPPLRADPEGMAQLLDNLVSNAIKYTPPGGWVRVAAQGDAGGVQLTVADSGIGIAPEDQAKIFDEFFRSQQARAQQSEGTGLGLAIVRAIVEAHGGKISVESALGRGSTFRVSLPAASAIPPT
jgi:signal transduction histidine kinase